MRLFYGILMISILTSATTAQAIPNMWSSGFGQGITEYLITNPKNVVFNLNCTMTPDEQNTLQHNVLIDLPDGTRVDSRDDKTTITVVTDDRQFPLPASLGWRNGDNAGFSLLMPLVTPQRSMFMLMIKK